LGRALLRARGIRALNWTLCLVRVQFKKMKMQDEGDAVEL
jgi:hypothetical protein